MKTRLTLVFDAILTNDYDISKIANIMEIEPGIICQKGQKYYVKKEKIYDASRCSYYYIMDKKHHSLSDFIVDTFLPIYDKMQKISDLVKQNNGVIRLTVYIEHIGRDFTLDVEDRAKEIVQMLNADIYFDFL